MPNVMWSELLDVPITARRRSTASAGVEIEFTETTTIRADGTYVTVLQSSDTPVMSSTQGTWSPHEDGRGICWHSAIEKGSFCTVFEKVDGQWYLVHRDTGLRWGPYVLAQEPR